MLGRLVQAVAQAVLGAGMALALTLALLALKAALVVAWLGLLLIGGALVLAHPVKVAALAVLGLAMAKPRRP